jgi:hypothetical protein
MFDSEHLSCPEIHKLAYLYAQCFGYLGYRKNINVDASASEMIVK